MAGDVTGKEILTSWEDCRKLLPYRDFEGLWQLPNRTQHRAVLVSGQKIFEYRERNATANELDELQW